MAIIFLGVSVFNGIAQNIYILKNQKVEVSIDKSGNLVSLKNLQTGFNYASGSPIWRLYFDRKGHYGNEISAKFNAPDIHQEESQININYDNLKTLDGKLNIKLSLKIVLEENLVRFCSDITNNELNTIVRELQFPLVADCRLPADHKLFVTYRGGQLFPDPKKQILEVGNNPPYMGPSQYFRQMDVKYPYGYASNCFAFTGDTQGLYFGSHDTTFQETWHGLRLYPDNNGVFDELEAGFYKYPNCLAGQSWSCDANVIAPYSGDWHQTSKIYRKWADTWWKHQEPPVWVQKMKSWQRIIFRHQYGETFFQYADLGNRIKKVGESVGVNTVFPFGWWNSGMDNGYPDSYSVTDPEQGGDEGWKKAIADFKKDGGKVLMYFNGKLIDTESDYYKNGDGKSVCLKSNTGIDYNEAYLFKAHDTFTGSYNARSFVIGDISDPRWQKKLFEMADQTIYFGADAVFYDQLGSYPGMNWDLSKEFPIPNISGIKDRAGVLKMIHQYIRAKDRNLAIGTEGLTDVTAQYVDFVHNLPYYGSYNFIEWFRYTFPEVIFSDREIRDDTDIERRVNQTVLKGLRNDIEIYRCRDLIDKTPHYQEYLAKINQLKDKYCSLLLQGTYRDTEGFKIDNPKVSASCFVNGNRLAVVVTQSITDTESAILNAPGYQYIESAIVGDSKVETIPGDQQKVKIGKDGLIVLIYGKNN